jgi:hypothetical protein
MAEIKPWGRGVPSKRPPPRGRGKKPPKPPRRPISKAKVAMRLFSILLGVVIGVGIAEAIFWWRDDGAFPHVNFYLPDRELGVRLEPGASMRLGFQDNPVTEMHVNSAGYRGAELGEARDDEILVVGDSQVFGLGVNDGETFSAKLAERTNRPVVNGGVPTYGPLEYTAVVREMLERRRPKTIVYVLNMANDWFEYDRPNRVRHAVWDGWAVRAETAPETITEFPGRKWLFRSSHLVYAIRQLWWQSRPDPGADEPRSDDGFASEGTWRDLVDDGGRAAVRHASADRDLRAKTVEQRTRLAQLELALGAVEDRLDQAILASETLSNDDYLRLRSARGYPGDIVSEDGVEEGREIALTARIIRFGVTYRRSMEARLASERAEVSELVTRRDDLARAREGVRSAAPEPEHVQSVLAERLAEVKALADEHGAELVVVALPLDVQVDAREWAKYRGREPIDMAPTLVLLTDLVETAQRMGVRALDATEALRAAGEGAFLRGDIHLTAKGHEAVANALAETLAGPPPLRHPSAGLPEGRTRVPGPDEWLRTREAIVRGSSRAGCETIRYAEWLRISCLKGRTNVPTGVTLVSGGHGETMTLVTDEATTFIAPIFAGDELTADFHFADRTQRLRVSWPAEAPEPSMYFEEGRPSEQPSLVESDEARRLCECHIEVYDEKSCEVAQGWPTGECTSTCATVYGEPSAECFAAYRDDCLALLRCVRGETIASPPCARGRANAGGTNQCFALCDDAHACPNGTCEPWQGAGICRR